MNKPTQLSFVLPPPQSIRPQREPPDLPVGKYKLTCYCGHPVGHTTSLAYPLTDPRANFTDVDGHPWSEKGKIHCRKCNRVVTSFDLTATRA